MKYSAVHKQLIVTPKDLGEAADSILWAMKRYRDLAGIPLKRSKPDSLEDIDFAEKEMLEGLGKIGIDLGAKWGYELDLSGLDG